tara:strand:- start:334 stop:513 length:180 start_codon:yes stop_codon:yes gene_type:complete
MNFNLWIDKNQSHINNIIEHFLEFLYLYKTTFNYEINDDIYNKIASYLYETSSSRNEDI